MRILIALCIFALALPCAAQTLPQYFVAAGGGFSRTSQPRVMGWLSGGKAVTANNYAYTTIQNITGETVTIQAGAARVLARQGAFSLLALGDVGAVTNNGNVGGAWSAGSGVLYDVSRLLKVQDAHAMVVVKLLDTTLAKKTAVFEIGILKGF